MRTHRADVVGKRHASAVRDALAALEGRDPPGGSVLGRRVLALWKSNWELSRQWDDEGRRRLQAEAECEGLRRENERLRAELRGDSR